MTYDYTQDIEGLNLTLTMSPSELNNNSFWAVPPSAIQCNELTSPNNAPLTFYNQTTYERQQIFTQIFKWM